MRIEGGTEAVDEGHRAKARCGARAWAVRAQALLHQSQEQAQGGALEIGIALQEVAQALDPARKALAKALSASRAALKELEGAYGQQAHANPEAQRPSMRGFKIAQAALGQQISTAQAKCRKLEARLAKPPQRVPLNELLDEAEIVKLAPEAKHFTDTIKMLAFRAETALVRCLTQNGVRTEDDGRALVREMLLSSADIVPQAQEHRLLVRLHSLAKPRHNKALAKLCATLNALDVRYPGSDLTLVYEAPEVA